MFKIVFDNAARDAARISTLDRQVITDLATAAGIPFVVITRTASTPEEQALAMYRNCVVDGPQNDLDMYSKYGDLVVQVYIDHVEKGVTAQAVVVGAMTRMIKQIGPERVSHHCVTDWSKLHVLDISSSRIEAAKRAPFEAAIAADKRISRHFSPFTKPKDPAFHLEILQSANA